MNIFLIPSWYPSARRPISGVFVREQAEALAALCPELTVAVSTWGFDDGAVPFSRPGQALRALAWRLRQQHDQVIRRNGVWEVFNPCLTTRERFSGKAMHRLLEVNRRNLALATSRFGAMSVIHAHVSYPAGFIARALSRESGIPYVMTEHMGPFPFPSYRQPDGELRPQIRCALQDAAERIAVSQALAADMARFGLPATRVIGNPVDERRFQPATATAGKVVFLTLCSIVEEKGVADLLRAIALWKPSPERFEFRIAGNGPALQSFRKLAIELGLTALVRWLGPVAREAVPDLFRQCSVFVLPSHHESFGVVYAEAIACGKPVVATRCGGPETIVNENNGRLVEVGNAQALADAMRQVATRLDEYDARAIRRDFENRFSRAAVVKQLKEVYCSMAGGDRT